MKTTHDYSADAPLDGNAYPPIPVGARVAHMEDTHGFDGVILAVISDDLYSVRWDGLDGEGTHSRRELVATTDSDAKEWSTHGFAVRWPLPGPLL